MSNQIGRLRQVGIGKESVKGTAVVPAFWLPVATFSPNPKVNVKKKEGAIGRIDGAYSSDIVSKNNEPSFDGYLTDKAAGLIFLAALGSVSTGAPSAGVYTHTFSVLNSNEHPSLTVSFKDANMSKQIPFCLTNELTLEANLEDYVRFSNAFIGRFEADGVLSPSFYATDNIFVSRHVSVKIADTVAGLAAATAVALQSMNLKVSKGATAIFGLSSDEPLSVRNGQLDITGNIVAIQTDEAWRDLFIGNTEKAMQIVIENSDVTIGSGSGHPKITITLPKVNFNPYKEEAKLSDLIKETVSFNYMYDLANAAGVTIALENTQPTY